MIHKMFAIYDSKAETYLLPYYFQYEGQATRMFSDWVNDPNHPFGKHPDDYTLYSIGEYDDNTGTISQDKITSIVNGLPLLTPKEK